MKKKFFKYLLLFSALFCITGCNKWLDVKPEDKFIEDQLYSSPQGFAEAMNGLYLYTASNAMYGRNLTMTTLDVMAQLYSVGNSDQPDLYLMSTYNYEDDKSKKQIEAIWQGMYTGIANVNKYLQSLDQYGSILDQQALKQYKGEALGLRAFYYFDLMRMFTKPYTSADSLTQTLPYYDRIGADISDFKPSNFIMQKILADLSNAEQLLLASDPVVGQARVSKPTQEYGRNVRVYRMNYYAVKALQARVNLWKGDKATALTVAKSMIAVQNKFPWIVQSDLNVSDVSNKIFATEMIFGAENSRLPDIFNEYFSPVLFDGKILAGNTSGTFINATVFENFANDYRNQYVWKVAGKPYPTFFKYQTTSNTSFNFNFTVPLIKMSEMYLIAAECEADMPTALGYINTLRTKRNILELPSTTTPAQLSTAIMKEYRKEFYGEGQLFYYYKRTKATSVIAAGSNAALTISAAKYVLPVPLSETAPR